MGLAGYTPARRTISVNADLSFRVRALTLTDIAAIIEKDLTGLDALFSRHATQMQNVFANQDADNNLILILVKDAPQIAGHLIALAADEPNATEEASKLPVPVMLQAIIDICDITFTDYGGPKKFFGMLVSLYQTMRPASGDPASPTTAVQGMQQKMKAGQF